MDYDKIQITEIIIIILYYTNSKIDINNEFDLYAWWFE